MREDIKLNDAYIYLIQVITIMLNDKYLKTKNLHVLGLLNNIIVV